MIRVAVSSRSPPGPTRLFHARGAPSPRPPRPITPADIEFAARRTAQLAFERVLFERGEEKVTTADVLSGIAETRRTLTPELVAEFEQDIQAYARV